MRYPGLRGIVGVLGAVTLFAVKASAQQASDPAVEQLLERARQAYTIPPKPTRCQAAAADEIVVCAPEDGEKFRIPAAESTDIGVPHVDVGTHAQGSTVARGCFLQKCPKEIYLIDLSKIPLPPPGSDAERIAKGEMRAP